jgi:hypothetical protein
MGMYRMRIAMTIWKFWEMLELDFGTGDVWGIGITFGPVRSVELYWLIAGWVEYTQEA